GRIPAEELRDAGQDHFARVLAGEWQHSLPRYLYAIPALPPQRGEHRFLYERGLAFLDDQHLALAGTELHDFLRHHRVGDVHAVDRHLAVAEGVRQAERLQRADDGVVEAAEAHDADVAHLAGEYLVQLVLPDEPDRGRPAHIHLQLFLQVRRRRQANAVVVEVRVLDQRALRKLWRAVCLGLESALHVTGANPQLEHHRRARHFRELEALLDHLDDLRQV